MSQQQHFSPSRQHRQPAHIGDYTLPELEQLAATALGQQQSNGRRDGESHAHHILRQICNEGSLHDLLGCLACAGEQIYLPTVICKSIRFIVLHPRDASVDRTEMLQRLLERLFDAAASSESWSNHLADQERRMAAASALVAGGNFGNNNYANAARVQLHAIGPLAHLLAGIIFCLYVDTVRYHNSMSMMMRPSQSNSQPPEMSLFTAGRQISTTSTNNNSVANAMMTANNITTNPSSIIQSDPFSPLLFGAAAAGAAAGGGGGGRGSRGGGLSAAALAVAGANGGIIPPHLVMGSAEQAAARLANQIADLFNHVFSNSVNGNNNNNNSGKNLLLHHLKRELVAEFTVQPRACDNDTNKTRVAFLTDNFFLPCVSGLRSCNFSDPQETRRLTAEMHEFIAYAQAKQTPMSLQLCTEQTLSFPPSWFREAGNVVGMLRFYFSNIAEALTRQQLHPRRDKDTVAGFIQLASAFSCGEPAADNMAALHSGSAAGQSGGVLDFGPGFSQSQGTTTAPNSQQAMFFDRQNSGGLSQGLSQQSSTNISAGRTTFGGIERAGQTNNDFDWNLQSHCSAMIAICVGMFRFVSVVMRGGGGSNRQQQDADEAAIVEEMLEACARILCNVAERNPAKVIEILINFDDIGNDGEFAAPTAEQLELLAQFCCSKGAFSNGAGGSENSLRAFMTFANVILQHLRPTARSMQQSLHQQQQQQQQQFQGSGNHNGGSWYEEEDSLWSGQRSSNNNDNSDNNNNSCCPNSVKAIIAQRTDELRQQLQRLTSNCLEAVFDAMVEDRMDQQRQQHQGADFADMEVVALDSESESNLATAGSILLVRRAGDCHFLGAQLIDMFRDAANHFLHDLQSGPQSPQQQQHSDGFFHYGNGGDPHRSPCATLSLVIETAAQAVGSAGALSGNIMTLNELEQDISQLLLLQNPNGGGGGGSGNPVPHNSCSESQQQSLADTRDMQYQQQRQQQPQSATGPSFAQNLERCLQSRFAGGGGGNRDPRMDPSQPPTSRRASSLPTIAASVSYSSALSSATAAVAMKGMIGLRIAAFLGTPLQQQQLRYGDDEGTTSSRAAGGGAAAFRSPITTISTSARTPAAAGLIISNSINDGSCSILNDLSSVLGGASSTNLPPISNIDTSTRFSFPGLDNNNNGRLSRKGSDGSINSGPSPIAQLLVEIFRFSEQLASNAIDALQNMLEKLTLGSSSSSGGGSRSSQSQSQSGDMMSNSNMNDDYHDQQQHQHGGVAGGRGASASPANPNGNHHHHHHHQQHQNGPARLIRPEHRGVFRSLFFLFRVAAQSGLHFSGDGNLTTSDTFAKAALRLAAFVLRSSGPSTPPILIRDALGTITRLWSSSVDALCETAFLPVADDLTDSMLTRHLHPVSRFVEHSILCSLGSRGNSGGNHNGGSAVAAAPPLILRMMLQSRQDTFACFFQRANVYCHLGRRVPGAELTKALLRNINMSWRRNNDIDSDDNNSSNNNDRDSSGASWNNISLHRINAARSWLRDVKAAFMPGRGKPLHSIVFHIALGVLTGICGGVDCDEVSCADDPDSPSFNNSSSSGSNRGGVAGGDGIAGLTPGVAGIIMPLIDALQQATCMTNNVRAHFCAQTDAMIRPVHRQQQPQQPQPIQQPPSPHPRPPQAVLESYIGLLGDFMDLLQQFLAVANSILLRTPASEQLPIYYSVVTQSTRILCEGVMTVHCLCAEDRFDLAGEIAASEHGDPRVLGSVDFWSPLRETSFFGPLCLVLWSFFSSKWFNFGVLATFDRVFSSDCFTLNRFINSGYALGAERRGGGGSSGGAGMSNAMSAAVSSMAVLSFTTSSKELTALLRTFSGALSDDELQQIGSVGRTRLGFGGMMQVDDVTTSPVAMVHKSTDFGLRSLLTVVGAVRERMPPRASACYMGWCATIAEWLREEEGGALARGFSSSSTLSSSSALTSPIATASVVQLLSGDDDTHSSSGDVSAVRVRRADLLRCMQALMCVTENPAQLVNPMFRQDWVSCFVEAILPLLVTNQLAMHSEAAISAIAVLSKLLAIARTELETAVSSIHSRCALDMHKERIDFIMRTLTEAASHMQAVKALVNQLCGSAVRNTMVMQNQTSSSAEQQPQQQQQQQQQQQETRNAMRRDVLHEPKVLTPF